LSGLQGLDFGDQSPRPAQKPHLDLRARFCGYATLPWQSYKKDFMRNGSNRARASSTSFSTVELTPPAEEKAFRSRLYRCQDRWLQYRLSAAPAPRNPIERTSIMLPSRCNSFPGLTLPSLASARVASTSSGR